MNEEERYEYLHAWENNSKAEKEAGAYPGAACQKAECQRQSGE